MTQRKGETWLFREAYSLACHIRLTLICTGVTMAYKMVG
jgi:hypothetical protein